MDGLDCNGSNTTYLYCPNEYQVFRIIGIIGIVLLVPTLILQLFFIILYRSKSTFLYRQFLYTTIVLIVIGIINILYPLASSFCSFLFLDILYILYLYMLYVEILQITTIHLHLLYKFSKHIETRTTQRIQTLCCNIRPRLWYDVMIVCIQFGLPLPILIADIVSLNSDCYMDYLKHMLEDIHYILIPVLAASTLLDLLCIVMLVVWVRKLWKRRLLRSKAKFVCSQISHILFLLVIFLIGNIVFIAGYLVAVFAIRIIAPVSFGIYILISLRKKTTTKAQQLQVTNRHTNPPSTRVSLPTDTAEHAPNFLSPSTAEPSEVTLLVND